MSTIKKRFNKFTAFNTGAYCLYCHVQGVKKAHNIMLGIEYIQPQEDKERMRLHYLISRRNPVVNPEIQDPIGRKKLSFETYYFCENCERSGFEQICIGKKLTNKEIQYFKFLSVVSRTGTLKQNPEKIFKKVYSEAGSDFESLSNGFKHKELFSKGSKVHFIPYSLRLSGNILGSDKMIKFPYLVPDKGVIFWSDTFLQKSPENLEFEAKYNNFKSRMKQKGIEINVDDIAFSESPEGVEYNNIIVSVVGMKRGNYVPNEPLPEGAEPAICIQFPFIEGLQYTTFWVPESIIEKSNP